MQEKYGPSSAPLLGAGARPPRSSLVAVLLGGLVVDVLGSILLVAVTSSVLIAVALGGGGLDAQIEKVAKSIPFIAIAAGGGALLVIAGGYTAAWWARRHPVVHALGAGSLSLVVSGFVFWLQASDTFWVDVASLALHLPLAVLGGWLYARTQPA